MTAILLCADLEVVGGGIDLDGVAAWLEAAIPGTRARIVRGLCSRPMAMGPHLARDAPDRLVLGLCARPGARADLQARARAAGIDPLTVEIVNLGTYAARVHRRPQATAKARALLAGAVARARAAQPGRPEHARLVVPSAASRRALLRLAWLEYESVPAVVADRCRADRGCTLCVEACPHGALRVVDGAAQLDRSACAPCGICVTACPHEAIELPGAMPAQLDAQVAALVHAATAELGPPGIVFTCQHDAGGLEDLARTGPVQPSGWLPVEVPCVAMVPAPWLLAALALGAASAGLLPAPEGCPAGTPAAAAGRVAYCRELLRQLDEPDERVAVLPARPPQLTEALGMLSALRPWAPASEPGALFAPRARAAVVLHLLASRPGAAARPVTHPHSPFGVVTVDAGCTLCGACAAACPAEALTREDDSGSVVLAFAAARCTACGRCVPACPEPGVLQLARTTDPQRLRRGSAVLARSPYRRCAACGTPFAPEAMAARVAALLRDNPAVARLAADCCPACRQSGVRSAHEGSEPVPPATPTASGTHPIAGPAAPP
jgi:ferredoxin